MQKTKGGCRWTIRLSNKDYAQKEVIRMFGYLLANGDYATESDIFREGIKSLYENKKSINNMEYVLVGDYYIPDLKLPNKERPIGKYGRMHREYLKEHNPMMFNDLVLDGQLWTYLADLNEQVQERLSLIVEQMKAAEGVTEELKASDQMAWVQAMNNIYNRAEEIILWELIYNVGRTERVD